jgi:hypothetical protein
MAEGMAAAMAAETAEGMAAETAEGMAEAEAIDADSSAARLFPHSCAEAPRPPPAIAQSTTGFRAPSIDRVAPVM